MWIIIPITLFVFIIGNFVYDNISLSLTMKKAGGMAVKYAELADACLACSDARILKETTTFISIGGKYTEHNITVNYAFWIQHTFNNRLIVKYVLKGPNMPQRVVQQWNFLTNQSQDKMIQDMKMYLDELMESNNANRIDRSKFIGNRYKALIGRLKMEDTDTYNLYTITVLKDTLLEYSFTIDMKHCQYMYSIRFFHGTGKLQIILTSTNYIKGQWEFPLDMSQSAIADKIEADINTMVMKKYDNSGFYE